MRLLLLLSVTLLMTNTEVEGQTEMFIPKTVDTSKLSHISKLLIVEPIVPYDDRVIRNTIKSAIVEEIDTILDYHFVENDTYVAKSNNTINVDVKGIINSHTDFDAILITIYSIKVIYDYSVRGMFIPLAPYPVTDNYSKIQMYLVYKNGDIIRKRSKYAISADRFGITRNPMKGIKNVTMLSTYSMIKKIININKTVQ